MDIKESLTELGKYGLGDAAVQYVWNKYAAKSIDKYLGTFGKYADVAGSFAYGLALAYLSDMSSEFGDYLKQGAASQIGRSISVALGDASYVPSSGAAPASSGSSNPWGGLAPVAVSYGAENQY